jgi:hypothetical protein
LYLLHFSQTWEAGGFLENLKHLLESGVHLRKSLIAWPFPPATHSEAMGA